MLTQYSPQRPFRAPARSAHPPGISLRQCLSGGGRVTPPDLTASTQTHFRIGNRCSHDQKGVTQMLTIYLCGALITAVAALGASIRFSDPRTAVSPVTRVSIATLAGALWPVVAVGALSIAVFVPLVKSLGTSPDARIRATVLQSEELVGVRPMAVA